MDETGTFYFFERSGSLEVYSLNISCSGDKDGSDPVVDSGDLSSAPRSHLYPPIYPPRAESVAPRSPSPETTLEPTLLTLRVRFNTTEVETIVSVTITNTEIKVQALPGFSEQTVLVRVFVSNQSSGTIAFYYPEVIIPPVITTVTGTMFYGAIVVITGENFSPIKEENIVKFGEIEATRALLTVTAPDLGSANIADVTVTKSDLVSNAMSIAIRRSK